MAAGREQGLREQVIAILDDCIQHTYDDWAFIDTLATADKILTLIESATASEQGD